MRRRGSLTGFIVLILLLTFSRSILSQEVWSEVSISKPAVYVGEPVEVNISVYTSTWFTRGVDLGNIKVNGAFTVFFRSVSVSISKNGRNYSGVNLIYNVFPYSEKDIVFPSLDITVETPKEGDYKGDKRDVKSEEKRIRVKPVPGGFDRDKWLVTTSLNVTDNWQGDLKNVKVGDVLIRRITRTVQGTVSELIPPILWSDIPGVSQYPARSNVENKKGTSDISASRTETMRFLFEKEGEVTIPEMVFTWYDPIRKQLYKRTLKEIETQVKPNPDPGVLASLRDSLKAEQAEFLKESEDDKPFSILGFTPEEFAVILILTVMLIYFLNLFIRRLFRIIKARREEYRNSEAFYFRRFIKTAKSKDARETINALYRWLDELKLPEPSLLYFARTYGSELLNIEVMTMEKELPKNQLTVILNSKEWMKARKRYGRGDGSHDLSGSADWINPVGYK
jgi:hypothetical protein